ncbi:type II toxin-antitoxin system prevent-host-death family antitoxin [Sphingobium sp. D43FB]|uniref:type II toxin-antitoxin system Phd/YefM family antitoxin n=1 Tax=Sphingobium sp. D43FB TaxID=2017595 RepID=UPI000BB59D63|nr:type II toxin-antitoxin system prevent-host-death family antitoxin [Sphingobium sp. D43FB]PBN41532.1 type II toxin-antitoxin system prevent-host-death family antitoxin [Sphingobium sp. D43FB]
MHISIPDAAGQLIDLVRRSEAGEEIILTREGHAAVRLVPVNMPTDRASRRVWLEEVRLAATAKTTTGPEAARSQDFLYGNEGMPG